MKKIAVTLASAALSAAAFAETGPSTSINQFTPPAGDMSVEYLREIFGSIIGFIHSGANVEGGQPNDVLGAMMTIFNSSLLFLGMIFVGYTTIKGTIDSAHDGELLGKKMSSVWVPLRTVGGTAFLLPLGSGYSLIQIAILWLSLQGVGIGDAIWKAAIQQMSQDNMITRPMIPDSRPLAASILKFQVCAAAMNKQFQETNRSTRIVAMAVPKTATNTGELLNYDVFDAVTPVGVHTTIKNFSNARYSVVDYKWRANDNTYLNPDVCGGISWKQSWEVSEGNSNTKVIKAPILAAHSQAIQKMIIALQPVAEQIVAGKKPAPGALERAAHDYENTLRSAAKSAVQNTSDRARSDFLKGALDGGWIFAGTWYNHIVKMNDVMQSTLNALPTSEPIDIADKETKEALMTYQDAIASADEYARHRVEGIRKVYYDETDIRAPREGEGAWEYVRKLISAPFMGAINQMTEEIAGSNLNHMSQMKSFGDTIVGAGEVMLMTLASATGVANSLAAKGTAGIGFDVGAVLQFLSGTLTVLLMLLLGFGVTLSTYVPMIPAITWTTSVVNWFVLVFEAVIAGPLFGIAHVHPDGDDAVGKAGQGYMMILSLCMRPALMLFGLTGAMLLTQPVTGMVNVMFMTVISGIQADSLTGVVSFIAYVAIYVITMTTVVHIVFSLIHWIPDNILRWLGSHGAGLGGAENKGDQGHDVLVGGVREVRHGAGGGLGGKSKAARPTHNSTEAESGRAEFSDRDLLGS